MNALTFTEAERLELQTNCDAAKTPLERNRLGQFATPSLLASDVLDHARRLLPADMPVRFLDPGIGTGSFYAALLGAFSAPCIAAATGFEIDPHYGEPARGLWQDYPLDIHLRDFTRASPPPPSERYNLIVCNPPYVRHHHLEPAEKVRLQEATAAACGVRLGGLAG
ncbi:MAG: hypothetical protein JWN14_1562, partial [Chthonomonadales bacterium]|nr:hypothetical protein [Chthonomonadales bacterium]